MAPVARELSGIRGVLEPLQSAPSIEGEIEELRWVITNHAANPVILIGYSWGAWLVLMLAAHYPHLVSRLVLVSSPPFTREYDMSVETARFRRLSPADRCDLERLKAELDNPQFHGNKNVLMARLGKLFATADSFDSLSHTGEAECRWDIFSSVWPQAAAMRNSGALLAMVKDIACPVVAIHGNYDPHPADGVKIPLAGALKDFGFILLENCGHTPWCERQARDKFFEILKKEVALSR